MSESHAEKKMSCSFSSLYEIWLFFFHLHLLLEGCLLTSINFMSVWKSSMVKQTLSAEGLKVPRKFKKDFSEAESRNNKTRLLSLTVSASLAFFSSVSYVVEANRK